MDFNSTTRDNQATSDTWISKVIPELKKLPSSFRYVPVDGKKAPYLPNWQDTRLSLVEFLKNHSDDLRCHAVGLLTGEASSGILAIDHDGSSCDHLIERLSRLPVDKSLPQTLKFTSGKQGRYQALYWVPSEYWPYIDGKKVIKTGVTGNDGKPEQIEFRWSRHQSVIAGKHPETGGYQWVEDCSPDAGLAPCPNWVLRQIVQFDLGLPRDRKQWTDIDKAISYLAAIPPSEDYDEWLKVGMCLKSVDQDLLDIWDLWSSLADNYNHGECARKWETFNRNDLGIGTLAEIAKQNGWRGKDKRGAALAHKKTNQKAEGTEDKKTTLDTLLELAQKAKYFHTADKIAYADVWVEGNRHTYPVRSKAFRLWLSGEYYDAKEKGIGAQTLQDTLNTLEAIAIRKGETHEVHLRVAEYQGYVYLDLGTPDWKAVAISPTNWQIISAPPVRFWRPDTLLPLPIPEQGGSLGDLKSLLNVDDQAWVLVITFLLFSLCPGKTYPILVLLASRGSGKSTIAEFLKSLIDPSKAPLIKLLSDPHNLAIAATRRALIVYDNVSYISPDQSDNLCTLATGFGFSTRTLHTSDEETCFELSRPQILTAIDAIVTRDDLADRTLLVNLPPIQDKQRLEKSELDAKLDAARPKILGGLLTALSHTLAALPITKPERLPRMADYGRFAIAAESAIGLKPGAFWEAFEATRSEARRVVLEASPVAAAIHQFMQNRGEWEGTADQLRTELNSLVDETTRRSKAWPADAARLGKTLNRLAPDLVEMNIQVTIARSKSSRIIHLENSKKIPSPPSPPSPDPPNHCKTNGFSDDSKGDSRVTVDSSNQLTVTNSGGGVDDSTVTNSEVTVTPTVTSESQSEKGFQPLGDSSDGNDGNDGKNLPFSKLLDYEDGDF